MAPKIPKEALETARMVQKQLIEEWFPADWSTILTTKTMLILADAAKDILLSSRQMLEEVSGPVKIFGDFHGQFEDLRAVMKLIGLPTDPNNCYTYVFMGDYVDRGPFQLEVVALLFSFFITHPDRIVLLRGNHECRAVNLIYGFYKECCVRFGPTVYSACQTAFDCLPVAARVNFRVLCMHGGISKDILQLENLNLIPRPCAIGTKGLLCDLLWSDPTDQAPAGTDKDNQGYLPSERGAGHLFTEQAVTKFLARHRLELVVRAHQVVDDGYEFFANNQLVTIFSAPMYCATYDNKGAVLTIDEHGNCQIEIYIPEQFEFNEDRQKPGQH
ncbi:unnamed protein product [Caenorhabditis sp. 36 PRJEB53466]|nr:unnamed protein product [Caenorhabditis sp. 36 PRJEB53466]